MDPIAVLLDYLTGTLPAPVVAKATGLVPVVWAVVRLARLWPAVEVRKRWAAPLLALLAGQIGGQLAVGFARDAVLLGAGAGLLIGLGAIGAQSAAKNAAQQVTK